MHMNYFSGILAQATPAGGPAQNPIMAFLPMVMLFVEFYMILIRPQQKRAKELAKLVESVKSGDKVVTSSGIVGVVLTVKDKFVTLRSADAKFEVTKGSISEIIESGKSTES